MIASAERAGAGGARRGGLGLLAAGGGCYVIASTASLMAPVVGQRLTMAILPIAIGHFLSIALVASLFLASGLVVDTPTLTRITGLVLIVWAAYHAIWGHRHRVRFGMQVSLLGLGAWSFLMATAHGAGLMLIPALMPLCFAPGQPFSVANAAGAATAGVLVHSVAMLATTAAIAVAVYDWIGLAILRSAWINVDLAWTVALAATGAYLLLS